MTVRLGLDLGQSNDYTALSAVETVNREFHVRQIGRLPLGLPYTGTAEAVDAVVLRAVRGMQRRMEDAMAAEAAAERHAGRQCVTRRADPVTVVIDGTGVGAGVVDILRRPLAEIGAHLRVVEICPGNDRRETIKAANGRPYVRAGKEWIIGRLQSLMQTNRIAAADTTDWQAVKAELLSFQRHTNARQASTFNAPSGTHDDLVIALALAVMDEVPGDVAGLRDANSKIRVRDMNPEQSGGVSIAGWQVI